ncbi:ABC transporter substrate-binding protein [Pseudodesulfovibrio portus]|uniref:Sugar ABC transporter substrate-binding protein n=1 Tax=Pseudodesulfovibrio portus TaxID=231439 RepID=A0ABM8AR05_9BACT|nr:ABC transporter substrate-binding protein [Pseudodesulfovibrio portus]BDQ33842.1 sugar ABC transporter substrate-binding protein [Pseudodesulfovibrio portus]
MKRTGQRFLWLVLCALLLAALPTNSLAAVELPSVTFVSPSMASKRPFWNDFIAFMKVAAEDLGINLTVLEADNRFEVNDLVRKTLSGQARPDYLVSIYQADTTIATLTMARDAGVKTLIVNTDVVDAERAAAGSPRGIYPSWIGHIFPDDASAGRMLAKRLFDRAGQMNLRAPDGKIHVIGLGGSHTATSSSHRRTGLLSAVADFPDVVVDQFVLAYWKREVSRQKAVKLLSLYPDATVFWAINDHTAMGVLDAMDKRGAVPGKDILTGGIDWSPECVGKVLNGSMVTTIGGHFMEGAWALLLLLDYHNGHDFAQPDPTLHSEMRIIDSDTAHRFLPVLDRDNWPSIDFRRLSKTYNPGLEKYDFSPDAVARQLSEQ